MHSYLKQSTASQSRAIGPFVDNTDFITPESGLTIANTDVKLSKNGASVVNKNSGGGTHVANGMYSFTFDATDTDTVGELSGSILPSGALIVPFKFTVVEESVYDSIYGVSASGYSTHSAADVWANGTRTMTSAANITSDSGVINSSSGIAEVNVKEINDNSSAALRLALSSAQIVPGTVDTTSVAATTSSFESDDITEGTNDHYNGRTIIFTSGALTGQATSITDYTNNGGNGVFTIVGITEAPADNTTFIII